MRHKQFSPIDVAAMFSILAYIGVGYFVIPAILLNPFAILSAFVLLWGAFVVAVLTLTPRTHPSARNAETREAAIAQVKAARRESKERYSRDARWWHHAIGVIAGSAFGALLILTVNGLFGRT